MKLIALPAFTDNYIWMLHDGHHAIVVDPGDTSPVMAALQALKLTLDGILVTHHHGDHTRGIATLTRAHPGIPVYGPLHEDIAGVTHALRDGDTVSLMGLAFRVLDTPGHTRGHITYVTEGVKEPTDPSPIAFVGDTLFSAGCGRIFDGSMEQLYDSLMRLRQLPDTTRVCAAHEYTLGNLRFAQAVEPDNPDLAEHVGRAEQLRALGQPTLPSRIGVEQQINPFLRCTESGVIASALRHGAPDAEPLSVFTALRQWKNDFR